MVVVAAINGVAFFNANAFCCVKSAHDLPSPLRHDLPLAFPVFLAYLDVMVIAANVNAFAARVGLLWSVRIHVGDHLARVCVQLFAGNHNRVGDGAQEDDALDRHAARHRKRSVANQLLDLGGSELIGIESIITETFAETVPQRAVTNDATLAR